MIKKSVKKSRWIILTILFLLFLILHPLTRPVIMLILPIGSGPDDLIVGSLFILFVVIWKGLK